MAALILKYGLPFVSVTLHVNNQILTLSNVLVDTDSVTSVFKTEDLENIGVFLDGTETIKVMEGIGGEEAVLQKPITAIEVGEFRVSPFKIQLGAMKYGYEMDGIIGMNFLVPAGAKIDFHAMTLTR